MVLKGTLGKVDHKYLGSFKLWCWSRMEIRWTDLVRNEVVLHRIKEDRNILHTLERRKSNWIGHSLRRNCLLKHVIEGKLGGSTEMIRRRGRRRKPLLGDLRERKLKEEALGRTRWRTRFGRGYAPVVRQTTERVNECRRNCVFLASRYSSMLYFQQTGSTKYYTRTTLSYWQNAGRE
jgi:hypothetical protein